MLPRLFEEIVAPESVLIELQHPKAPDEVRNWANRPPNWLRVESPQPYAPIANLHLGENDAIALTIQLQADGILVDERSATRHAIQLGLHVISTLSVLGAAAKESLILLEPVIARLKQTTFRGPTDLMEEMLEEDRQRRTQAQ